MNKKSLADRAIQIVRFGPAVDERVGLEDALSLDPNVVAEVEKEEPTTRGELWGYYYYYCGDNGVNTYTYVPLIMQALATAAGYDPRFGQETPCNTTDVNAPCDVSFGPAGSLNVSSMVLLVNGLTFFLQMVLFVSLGSLADYGNLARWLLISVTVISCLAQMLVLLTYTPEGWVGTLILNVVVNVSYGASLVFYAALFPRLAWNMPHVRNARKSPILTADEKDAVFSEERNRISVVSTAWSNIGFILISLICLGQLTPYQNNNDPYGSNVASAVCGGFWFLLALPYFFFQRKRPGPPLPTGSSYLTIGWIDAYKTLKHAPQLPETFKYIAAYFVLSDALSTTGVLIQVVSNKVTSFDSYQQTLYGLSQGVASTLGCFIFLWIQRSFNLSAKFMLQVCAFSMVFVAVWGCFGIRFDNFGIKTVGELWFYNVWFGLLTSPYYAYTQTVMAELIPRGHENQYFALFGVMNKGSSWIGPIIISLIIGATESEWYGFPFCAVVCFIPMVIIGFVDMDKAQRQLRLYEANEAKKKLGSFGSDIDVVKEEVVSPEEFEKKS